jgi:hypothetical protein
MKTKNKQDSTKVIEKKEKIETKQVRELSDLKLSDSTGASPNTLKFAR